MGTRNVAGKERRRYLLILSLFLCGLEMNAMNEVRLPSEKIEPDTIRAISCVVRPLNVDSVFFDKSYAAEYTLVPSGVNIYDLPYSATGNYPNYKRLALNTGVLYGAGFVALGVLHALPEDATSWNRDEIMGVPPFKRWWRNVKKGPVIDKDNPFFNYVLHPYGGAAYYMGARSQGFNLYYSMLYAAGISTLFWEYGIEAFMEIPSIQDLIVTPVAGTIIGEGFYLLKRHIVSNGYRLFGSPILGNVIAYIIDPVNEVVGIFAGNPNRKKLKADESSLAVVPWFGTTNHGKTIGFVVSLSF